LLVTISMIVSFLSIALLLVAAYRDVTTFTIPNRLCVGVAALATIQLIAALDFDAALYTIAVGIIVFLIGLLLFQRGYLGGGDVKMLSATVLLVGCYNVLPFLACMSIAGGFVALIVFGRNKLAPKPTPRLVPYGVAIASAGIAMMLHHNFNLFG
jgi:prepilin peptidase CpaA